MKAHLFDTCPLLPPAICLMACIAIGCPLPAGLLLLLLAMLTAASLLAGRWPMVQSAATMLCFLVFGMLVAPRPAATVPDGQWTEAVVASVPADRPKTLMADLLLPATGGKRRCFIWKDARSQQIRVGQNLLVRIRDARFIGRADWQPGGDGFNRLSHLQRLRLRALKWRGSIMERLFTAAPGASPGVHPSVEEEKAKAVLAAMVLGDKSALTRELRDAYSTSGAAHILALSGLHLSIIYLLLTRLTLGRRRAWLTQLLIVLAIWAYALLTGLSTSVVRSATMLTVYALFSLGGRRHASLGVLSFTAILMLLADSQSLFDVGFQLSFMSMLGILLFHPLISGWVSLKWMMAHPPVRWAYELLGTTVAAQLGTAPLVAYYFGQLPVWFLPANLVVIPLATLILYGAVFTLVVPALGSALLWLVSVLNALLEQIAALPLASISGLHPSVLQTVMVYVLIGVVYALLRFWHPKPCR